MREHPTSLIIWGILLLLQWPLFAQGPRLGVRRVGSALLTAGIAFGGVIGFAPSSVGAVAIGGVAACAIVGGGAMISADLRRFARQRQHTVGAP